MTAPPDPPASPQCALRRRIEHHETCFHDDLRRSDTSLAVMQYLSGQSAAALHSPRTTDVAALHADTAALRLAIAALERERQPSVALETTPQHPYCWAPNESHDTSVASLCIAEHPLLRRGAPWRGSPPSKAPIAVGDLTRSLRQAIETNVSFANAARALEHYGDRLEEELNAGPADVPPPLGDLPSSALFLPEDSNEWALWAADIHRLTKASLGTTPPQRRPILPLGHCGTPPMNKADPIDRFLGHSHVFSAWLRLCVSLHNAAANSLARWRDHDPLCRLSPPLQTEAGSVVSTALQTEMGSALNFDPDL